MFSVSNRSNGGSQSQSSSLDKDEFIRDESTCYMILDEWRLSDEDDLRIRTPRYENELPKESSISGKKDESIKNSSNKQDQSTTKSISRQDELPKKSKRETDECDLTDFESSKRRRLSACIDRHKNIRVRERILDEFRKLRKSTDWKIKEKRMRLLQHFDYLHENYGALGQVPYPQAVFPPEEMESLLFDAISAIAESTPGNEDTETYVLFLRFAANSGYRIEPAYDAAGQSIRRRVTAVHRAALCHSYYRSAVRDLFEIYGRVDVNYVDDRGLTHFHVACRFGFEDIARDFLELGRADVGECSSDTIDAPLPPLTWSLAQGNESMAELLLSHGADANGGACCPTTAGTRPLHALCARPNDAGFDFLERHFENPKQRGILMDAADGLGNTPLHLALASDSTKTVGWLLDEGADPNLANEAGETPLHVICKREKHDDEALLDMFLKSCSVNDRSVSMDARDSQAGDTPLHSALRRGHSKLAESLLRRGADPSLLNAQGQSPLHAICMTRRNLDGGSLLRKFLEISDELGLLGRLKLDAADSRGRSPLQYAVARLKPRAVEALLRRGADVASFRFPDLDLFFDNCQEEEEDDDDDDDDGEDLKSKHVRVSGALVVAELLVNAGYQLDRRDAATMMKLYVRNGLFEERMIFDICNDRDFIEKTREIAMTDAEPKFSIHEFFLLSSRPRELADKITYVECYELIANSQKLSAMNPRQEKACLVLICEKMWRVFFHRFAADCFWELDSYKFPLVKCDKLAERLPTEDLYRLCMIATNDDKFTAKVEAATMLLQKAIARRERERMGII